MKKLYRPKISKYIYNIFLVIFGSFFFYIILNTFFKNIIISIIIPLLFTIFALYVIISNSQFEILILDDDLIIETKKKNYEFKISKCTFNYFVKNDDYYLYINFEDKDYSFDLSLLTKSEFDYLLKDLKVNKDNKVKYLRTK